MKKNKKILVLLALFLAVFAVGGTLAYLTDTSESATNTFTFGKVNISLSEPTWTTTGSTNAGSTVPGEEIDKDPTIKVESDSENAFVFAKVTIPTGTAGGVADQELFELGTLSAGWIDVTPNSFGAGEYLFAYGTSTAMTSVAKNTTLAPVFTTIKSNPNLTETEIAALTNRSADVVVNAYAIQAEGLDSTAPADVWGDLGI